MLLLDVARSGKIPFIFGLSIPMQFEPFKTGQLASLVEHAFERGFDFLLAPRTFAPAGVQAGCAARALPRVPVQSPLSRTVARDLIWLGQGILAAEGSSIVSINENDCGLQHATILRQQIRAIRDAGEKNGERRVLLEIGFSEVANGVATEEDDILESFVTSLGKRLSSAPLGATGKQKIECEELYRLLTLAKDVGCDGISLAVPDPFGELPLIQKPHGRPMSIH